VVRAPGGLARPVQVVDATIPGWPGPREGVAWRIHARLALAPTRFTGFVLTDGSGAERLDRFAPTPGAIVLADRCYARHGGMAAVWGQGADLVVRHGLGGSALHDPTGARATLRTGCCAGRVCRTGSTCRCGCRGRTTAGMRAG
jgi:hypothetical protein